MAFFQSSVLNRYLQALNTQQIQSAYSRYRKHFHNPEVQQNIRTSKEEQYQEGFLRDLFVGVLGYTLNPNAGFNLTTEYKNIKDSKKADGAILLPSPTGHAPLVRAVIELKGTETIDLDKIESQAFGYKNNQPECTYIIISNFEKLRFYIDNAIDHIEFNLFTLTEKEFELLWLCLAYENIAADLPRKIKTASVSEEDTITKKLYKDYSLFKRELYQNLVALNPDTDELLLFKKSQKLLDRFLFLFFAEDRQLLPPNSVRAILKQWDDLKDLDAYFPLYSRFKMYFGYLNTGHKGKHHDVFAYNGGLFKPDDILDAVEIDDDLLYRHTLKLSDYDFASEVDVNILGHIFENSLNELDELKAELEGHVFDKTKSKRKKDGIVYTPKYITKYIVDNTVGKLCAEKKAELGIIEEDYYSDKKRQKKTIQALAEKLNVYRNWLLKITICDPACGSGAFLNQALNFLIDEHRLIDEMQAKLFGDTLVLSDVEKSILENNLFGVDINEESVEIAKLSLWLRTAQPNRKLNDLSNNIKCGNSLIDDPTVAGEKAFDWEKEFPQVFGRKAEKDKVILVEKIDAPDYLKLIREKTQEAQLKAEQGLALSKEALEIAKQLAEYAEKLDAVSEPKAKYGNTKSGFDVVIGNPPYLLCQPSNTNANVLDFYKTFRVASYKIDLFHLFFEKSIMLLKQKGKLGFITPNTYFSNKYIQKLRSYILSNTYIDCIVNHKEIVFVDAGVDVATLILTKKIELNPQINIYKSDSIGVGLETTKSQSEWIESAEQTFNINPDLIFDFNECFRLDDIANTYFGIQAYDRKSSISPSKLSDNYLSIIDGADVNRYQNSYSNKFFNYVSENIKSGGDWSVYSRDRIVVRQIGNTPIVGYCEANMLTSNTIYNIYLKNENYSLKYLFAILNSKIIKEYWLKVYNDNKELFPKIKGYQLKQLPIPKASKEQQQTIVFSADNMISLNINLMEASQKFQRMLQRKFDLDELPGKLQNWHALTFKEFISELGKKKIKLTLAQEAQWEDYFNTEQAKALEIKKQIEDTDKEIDRMVYELYGLTEEEVGIVEE